MDTEEFFHLTEESIQCIRRVRYPELGIFLISEQIWEIVFQTVACGSDSFVRVVEMFSITGIRPFLQEMLPLHEPLIEEFFEIVFTNEGERSSDGEQFLSRFELRFRGEVPSQDRLLMEMAHLDGDVRKDLSHASPAVENDRLEGETHLLHFLSHFTIHRRILSSDELPEDIPLQSRSSEHEHSVTAREERDIGGEDEGLRGNLLLFKDDGVELFLDTWNASLILLGKLYERLLVPDVLFPKIQMFTLRLPIVLKLLPASQTFVPLDSVPLSILLYFS